MRLRPPSPLIVAVAVVVLALVGVGWTFLRHDTDEGAKPQDWTFVTEPDLTMPMIDVSTSETAGADPTASEGLVFLGLKDNDAKEGPVIVDGDGNPVWIGPDQRVYCVRVQQYQGKPVLTYWRGDTIRPEYGVGEYVLLNQHYQEIATVTTHGMLGADYHDMTLTDRGTALLIGHRLVRRDLTSLGGPPNAWVSDGFIQEVDVATGKVVFQWDGLKHIPVSETQISVDKFDRGKRRNPVDYTHLNSVTEYGDDLLISARNTSAVYRVDRDTGKVMWTLGGKASDFRMLGKSRFYWQHSAQLHADGTITLFDNQANPPMAETSRGLRLALDMQHHTARVVTEYLPPDDRLAGGQGNLQVLPDGNVFIGWGSEQPYYSEYTADGRLLLDGTLSAGESYRSYLEQWVGRPTDPPKLTVDGSTAYVSWNGATEVTRWRFLAGPDAASAREVGTVPREGFETSAEIPDANYIAVQALDATGRVLATVER